MKRIELTKGFSDILKPQGKLALLITKRPKFFFGEYAKLNNIVENRT